jgi:hypothetical protein
MYIYIYIYICMYIYIQYVHIYIYISEEIILYAILGNIPMYMDICAYPNLYAHINIKNNLFECMPKNINTTIGA